MKGKNIKNNYKVIGMMSGTSLDGLDIAFCEFNKVNRKWEFSILHSTVLRYPNSLKRKLSDTTIRAQDLMELDAELGVFLGKACATFIEQNKLQVDFIASHGHTIFHQPHRGFTTQIGNGNAIHAVTGLPVVFDFRALDVALGGQGAPLVPAGDRSLFSEYDICLNLGGIANLSAERNGERKAFDICFCNMALNYLVGAVGKEYDKGGVLASTGNVDEKLFSDLTKIYKPWARKRLSLGKELFDIHLKPLLDTKRISLPDKLATCVESSAAEIINAAKGINGQSILCTGGGAFNSYLISRMLELAADEVSIILPEVEVIKLKEALIFAFLGVLAVRGEVNCLKSVTGAKRDSRGGVMVGF
jgi:anhydro-N-acetylmuramic acid kinase